MHLESLSVVLGIGVVRPFPSSLVLMWWWLKVQSNVEKVCISNKKRKMKRKTYMKLETCPLCWWDCHCRSVVIRFVGILGAMVVVVVVVVMMDVLFCRPLMVPVVVPSWVKKSQSSKKKKNPELEVQMWSQSCWWWLWSWWSRYWLWWWSRWWLWCGDGGCSHNCRCWPTLTCHSSGHGIVYNMWLFVVELTYIVIWWSAQTTFRAGLLNLEFFFSKAVLQINIINWSLLQSNMSNGLKVQKGTEQSRSISRYIFVRMVYT